MDLAKPGKVDAAQVKKLAKAIDRLAAETLDESELQDDHAERLLALARAKRERGEDVVEAPAELRDDSSPEVEGADVIDLVALLKQRLGRRARPGAREMKKASNWAGGK